MHSTTLRMIVLRRGLADQFGEAATICVNRGAQQASPNLGGRTYGDQNEVFTAAAYLDLVRSYCSSRPGPKDYICFALADEAPPFAETDVERIYRLACDYERRDEGCAGYATLMERRGEATRALEYRDRGSALAASARRPSR
jgi:hypothetical protein